MAKIKLTKNELKLQRDALKRFQRYLPTLQLKKQQLQQEVRQTREILAKLDEESRLELERHADDLALLSNCDFDSFGALRRVIEWRVENRNIAGTEVPVFSGLDFLRTEYDLFEAPLWFEELLELAENQTRHRLHRQLVAEQLESIENELRTVNQRVNLFEKVKIPDAQENIRRINIYLGDQQTNSVGRSKIAKAKCQARDAAME
ncbi:MAG: V-type ATP synthase subunit D [Victivallales bacterium]|jgi:V/A-type H+-transporting ATPase subunit D|nr:V-type ATP synthase subunit D [Victivallales bacterium]